MAELKQYEIPLLTAKDIECRVQSVSKNKAGKVGALREKLERGKGCRYCQDKSYKQKGYYVDDPEGEIVGINHYCMNCGKRLEVKQND